ncbi:uncharacterized protein JN550_009391 [Neoarthrinium moseri]|uniref:uncharacterized protein n=1 Tax=Neoarthrinium moseri TaxID=1658444 RepID=UPI001FDE5F04|nr:uncharacterized protein JN550_009391 [Neoarthrinium moseri]KAI1863691.1 hypothetical protein JN550_009391 [Neoarthrinium moseri]
MPVVSRQAQTQAPAAVIGLSVGIGVGVVLLAIIYIVVLRVPRSGTRPSDSARRWPGHGFIRSPVYGRAPWS